MYSFKFKFKHFRMSEAGECFCSLLSGLGKLFRMAAEHHTHMLIFSYFILSV